MNQSDAIRKNRQHLKDSMIAVAIMVLVFATGASAQTGRILVRGGNKTLNITTSVTGAEPTPVVNTTATLRYWRQAKICKITVRTMCPGQNFNLAVVATGVVRGVAAPQVNLVDGMLDVDFITNIPNAGFTNTTPTLRYTASSTFAQGNSAELGNDVYAVTYTILAQ